MADITKIAEDLSGLTVLEVAELVETLEEKWGVSAAAPVAAVAAVAGDGADSGGEEKTEFNLVLKGDGGAKIAVIKEVRGVVAGLGLAEAKKMVEDAPTNLLEGVSKEEAEEAKTKLEAAGAEVSVE